MVGGVNSHLESNPIPTRDAKRAQTNYVNSRTQGPYRDWDRTVFEHLLWMYGSVTVRATGLWVQQTRVWHKPSWRRSPLTHHRAARTYTGLGKLTLGRHKQNLVHQEKGAVTHKGLTQTFLCV